MKIFNKLLNVLCSPSTHPDPDTLTLALHGNPRINMLAGQCAQATLQLIQKSAHQRFVRAAVAQAAKSGSTAEQYLRDQLAAIQGEIEAFDADTKAGIERRKDESAEAGPLWIALMHFENGITGERDKLREGVRGIEAATAESLRVGMKSGLSQSDLTILGRFDPPDAKVEGWKLRIEEIDAQLAQIAAFSADPLKRMGHLAGLPVPGFEQQLAGSNE